MVVVILRMGETILIEANQHKIPVAPITRK